MSDLDKAEMAFLQQCLPSKTSSAVPFGGLGVALKRLLVLRQPTNSPVSSLLLFGRVAEQGNLIVPCMQLLRARADRPNSLLRMQTIESLRNKRGRVGFVVGVSSPVFPFTLEDVLGTNLVAEPADPRLRAFLAASIRRKIEPISRRQYPPRRVVLTDLFINDVYQLRWDGGYLQAVDPRRLSARVAAAAAEGEGNDVKTPSGSFGRDLLRTRLQQILDGAPPIVHKIVLGDGQEHPRGVKIKIFLRVILPKARGRHAHHETNTSL